MTESLGGATATSALQSLDCSVSCVARDALPAAAAHLASCANGGLMRRLFVIWNRGYRTINVIANDAAEALQIAASAGHMKRPNMYRKYQDVTDEMAPQDAKLRGALDAGKSGVATNIEDDGWAIGGERIN